MSDVPVGTIIPWVPEANLLTGTGLPEHLKQSELPNGWVHCDGSVIPKPSSWHGTTTPNLNEEQCFLFPPGNKDPQELIKQHMQTELTFDRKSEAIPSSPGTSTKLTSTILRVFWIMRIW